MPERVKTILVVDDEPGQRAMLHAVLSAEGYQAVEAMKAGAYDYLTKPLDIDELKLTLARGLRHAALEEENARLRELVGQDADVSAIIGTSEPMRRVFEAIALVAPTEATVLILGESGTGKELVAQAIHANSPRRAGPLVTVNCAALP